MTYYDFKTLARRAIEYYHGHIDKIQGMVGDSSLSQEPECDDPDKWTGANWKWFEEEIHDLTVNVLQILKM